MQLELLQRRRRRLVSLTPLIDVVFIMLLFFMLASNFQQWRALKLSAPGKGALVTSDERALQLRVRTGGGLDLGGVAIPANTLMDHIRPYLARNPDQAIVVQSDADVRLRTLVGVFDKLSAAGVQQITFGEP